MRDQLSIPISVDTYKAEVAERAIELGAEIINDPSGLTFDPQLTKTVMNHNVGVILNHMRGTPDTWAKLGPLQDVMGTVVRELGASVHRARLAGVDAAQDRGGSGHRVWQAQGAEFGDPGAARPACVAGTSDYGWRVAKVVSGAGKTKWEQNSRPRPR